MDFMEILKFRHACKVFDENKKISETDFMQIMEAARLSPSSFGLEEWDFLLIENQELKEKIRKSSWDQIQITSCSHLVIILAKISDLKPNSDYIEKMILRRSDKNSEQYKSRIGLVNNYIKKYVGETDDDIYQFSRRQDYLAAQNMMNMAASLKIDSCPIEGFERKEVEDILNLDTKKQKIGLMMTFGYRIKRQPERTRRLMSDILTVIK